MSAASLSGIEPAGRLDSPVHRCDARAKLIALTAVPVTAVTAGSDAWGVYAGCLALLALLAATAGVGPRELWRRLRVVLPLALLAAVALPFVRDGGAAWGLGPLAVHQAGLELAGAVAAKATIGTVAAATLAATTSVPSLLEGLERLRVPRLLTAIAGLTYRYLFVLGGELGRMRQALTARCHRPRSALAAAPTGRLAGALFLRAHARGERVQLAIVARGGGLAAPRRREPRALAAADVRFLALVLAALVVLRLLAA